MGRDARGAFVAALVVGDFAPCCNFSCSTTCFHFFTMSFARSATCLDACVRSFPTARPALLSYSHQRVALETKTGETHPQQSLRDMRLLLQRLQQPEYLLHTNTKHKSKKESAKSNRHGGSTEKLQVRTCSVEELCNCLTSDLNWDVVDMLNPSLRCLSRFHCCKSSRSPAHTTWKEVKLVSFSFTRGLHPKTGML